MGQASLRALLQQLRRIVGSTASAVPDAQLLERFVRQRDEAAFELLVWRHAPMVLGVCQRVLRHEQDAEDAFQATFLILARKARSIGTRQALAGWLYQVAYRNALAAKIQRDRRVRRESSAVHPRIATATDAAIDLVVGRDLRTVLDEEIQRLPAKYRTVLILCYLKGKTYAEAARELGCPKGTVAIRLLRARELLRPRLVRRGLAVSSGALAELLAENTCRAAVSASLVETTAKAALLFATSRVAASVLSGCVLTLAEGVLQTMFLSKLKIVALVAGIALASSGAGVLTYHGLAGEVAGAAVQTTEPLRALQADQKVERQKSAIPQPIQAEKAESERSAKLLATALAFQRAETDFERQERMRMDEMIQARLRLAEIEDKLKSIDKGETPPELRQALGQVERSNEELQAMVKVYRDPNNPRLLHMRERLQELEAEASKYRQIQKDRLGGIRLAYFEAEEELHLLERRHTMQRERAWRRLEAAEERVRALENTANRTDRGTTRPAELESKLDRLLREMSELRQEVRRLQSEKRSAPTERRPDQP